MVTAAAAADDSRTPDERGRQEDESEEEDEVESGDEDEGDGDGSEVTRLSDLCDPDAGSDEDPTFDPDADGDLEVEIVLRSRMSWMSISASACKGRKGSAVLAMGKEEIDLLAMVDKLIHDGELEKLKVYQCKSYLRMHKLRLTGKKEVLLNRIRDHIEVKNAGEEKYPVSSFVLNCKGDACKGDVVMFEQNIYRRKKGAPREVKHLCGQRTNAGRIIKESYGTAKQQHTFTIEILWSKGYKPWSPLHPLLIKGRNLYKEKTMRQPWTDEEERNTVLKEKHARGFVARKSRASRIQEKEIEKKMRFNRCVLNSNTAGGIKENKTKEQLDMNQKPYKKVIPQVLVEPMTTVHQRYTSEVFGVSRGGKQEAKDTWWWNDKVQRAIKEKKECFKRLHLDKSATNIEGYKIAKRAAKRAVSVAKGQAYDNLYQRLGTKEGEKDIYRMARIRERKTRDITTKSNVSRMG
ncbi:hypothetical protein PR202_gb07868 [Eleusine coracana subsp. coracana]|uniref:SAP domain-containing protein n=1 Tax=Eleusine coracana subsp. coracana TaxID=191504 RepID=A0AAV5EE08_ELECO|nr:hypothetical protein PR202_gb07868 [Eleusine coracana subsp. coracana]